MLKTKNSSKEMLNTLFGVQTTPQRGGFFFRTGVKKQILVSLELVRSQTGIQ
jgi:hypothetical protein